MSAKRAADWSQSFGHQPIDPDRVRAELGRRLRKIYSSTARAPLPVRIVELVLQVDRPPAVPSSSRALGSARSARKEE